MIGEEDAEDKADLEAARKIIDSGEKPIPWDEAMANIKKHHEDLDKLDRLAAEKVLGKTQMPEFEMVNGKCYVDREFWQPTRNIAQAWECLEKADLLNWYDLGRIGTSYRIVDGYGEELALADTAPEAIVRAVLKDSGVEV